MANALQNELQSISVNHHHLATACHRASCSIGGAPPVVAPIAIPAAAPQWTHGLFQGINQLRQAQAASEFAVRRLEVKQNYEQHCAIIRFENSRATAMDHPINPLPTMPVVPQAAGVVPPLGPPPNNFPPTLGALRSLRGRQTDAILRAYSLPLHATLKQRRARIATFIGCPA